MQLVCPSCAATYSVPDAMIGAGRNMRCVRCQHDWFAAPPGPDAAPAPAAMPAQPLPMAKKPLPLPAARQAAPPAPVAAAGTSALLALAWIGSLGLVAAGGWALWAYRAPLADLWPPLSRLYALLGA